MWKKKFNGAAGAEHQDIYNRVTNRIIADLEKGVRPWVRPWDIDNSQSLITRPLRHNGLRYTGINVLLLWSSAMENGFRSPTWMTFRQANELEAHVRKGEKGSLVVYANTITKPKMSKDPLRGALTKSLQDETAAVDDRFARAERVLGGGQAAAPEPRHAKAPPRKKRIRVVRDTFSFPEPEYALLESLRQRCLNSRHSASKSEVIRAGLSALAAMSEADLLAIVRSIERLKPGSKRRNS